MRKIILFLTIALLMQNVSSAQTLSAGVNSAAINDSADMSLLLSGSSGNISGLQFKVTISPPFAASIGNFIPTSGSVNQSVPSAGSVTVVLTNTNSPFTNGVVGNLSLTRNNTSVNISVTVSDIVATDINGMPVAVTAGGAGLFSTTPGLPDFVAPIGVVDIADFNAMIEAIINIALQEPLMDRNADGVVDIVDAFLVYSTYIATTGNGTPPPMMVFGGNTGLSFTPQSFNPTGASITVLARSQSPTNPRRGGPTLGTSNTLEVKGVEHVASQQAPSGRTIIFNHDYGLLRFPLSGTDPMELMAGQGTQSCNEAVSNSSFASDTYLMPQAICIPLLNGDILTITEKAIYRFTHGSGGVSLVSAFIHNQDVMDGKTIWPVKRAVLNSTENTLVLLGENGLILRLDNLQASPLTYTTLHQPSFNAELKVKDIALSGTFLYMCDGYALYRLALSGTTFNNSPSSMLVAGSLNQSGNADGSGLSARFGLIDSITADTAGDIFIADQGNKTIREFSGGSVTTIGGNGTTTVSSSGPLSTSVGISFISKLTYLGADNSLVWYSVDNQRWLKAR